MGLSSLAQATSLASKDILLVVQGGESKHVTYETLVAEIESTETAISTTNVSSNRTLSDDDLGVTLICTGSITITLPDDLEDGFWCNIVNAGSGTVTLETSGSASMTPETVELIVTDDVELVAASLLHDENGEWYVTHGRPEAVTLMVAVSDEDTNLSTGTAKITFRMPFAMVLEEIRANVNTAPTGSDIVVDVNEDGSSILSTKLSIDDGEKTSVTAETEAVISDEDLADDAEITVDIDQVGSSTPGQGLKLTMLGYRV